MQPIRVFVGYDPREAVAYNVFAHSILRRASVPVTIAPVALKQLFPYFNRPRDELQSTDFSFSRFMVPWLSGYKGWSIFADCDMLMLGDIASLYNMRDERYAAMVVKHDHAPGGRVKFLGAKQTTYPKKNWSSVMLLNNERCGALSPQYVNQATGLDLHRFNWLEGDHLIGDLPACWNHLVGYDRPDGSELNLHYTEGGPWFKAYEHCPFADLWRRERDDMLYSQEQ